MATYRANGKRRHGMPRRLVVIAIVLLAVIVAAIFGVRHLYYQNLAALNSDPNTQIVTVQSGTSVKQIASLLHKQHLIRNAWAFEWYVHSKELSDKLQAGTYALASNEDVPAIVQTLTQGKVTTRLVTIIPGKRLDQVRADLINAGFSPASVDSALQPGQYSDLPVLAFKPASVDTLEGLLYPDSFQKDASTGPSFIVRESLTEMGQKLTPDIQAAFATEGLSPYQGIILASIVEQEVSKPSDRAQVAQVFLTRLHSNMQLGSDVTVFYARTMAKINPGRSYDAYDTTSHTGLPPAPISIVSASSLQAVAHPANTNWLYFVAGDDGTTYFSTTLDEHNQQVQQYCHKLCAQNN